MALSAKLMIMGMYTILTAYVQPPSHLICQTLKSGYANIEGRKVYYEEKGRGHVLILIHGLTLDTRMWDDQFVVLAGYPTIAKDSGLAKAKEAWLKHPFMTPRTNMEPVSTRIRRIVTDWSGAQFTNPGIWQFKRALPPAIRRLNEIHVPTLVIVGERDDPNMHAIADTLASGIGGAMKVVMAGSGHLLNLERPDEFNGLIIDCVSEYVAQRTDCDEVVVRNQSNPVWNAIDVQYAKLAEAIRKKDLDALFALYTADYLVKMSNGEVWDREKSLAYQRERYAQVIATAHISNTIISLTVCGEGKATATVLQQWYRTQSLAGKVRRVETNAIQDEHWVKTPDGWKRGNIDEIRAGASFVDGKRVEVGKPYDPEAPAFDPQDPHPRLPMADTLFRQIAEKGTDSAISLYRTLRLSNDFYATENMLNGLGYRLLNLKQIKEAIEIFKLNVEAYPQSANVYDSLGEAYMLNGDKGKAIMNYQKSVELNPHNANAVEQLKKLRGQ